MSFRISIFGFRILKIMSRKTITKTVEQILSESGMTAFHKKVVLITGLAWSFVAMEILLIAFTLPLFANIWQLTGLALGAIGAASLIGSFVGSISLGFVIDKVGRRPVFMMSVLWYSIFTYLTGSSWDPTSLFIFRFLSGVGLGGMLVVDPSFLSEYLPPQKRGKYMVFLDFFWPVGSLLALGLAYYFLEQLGGQWRLLFKVAAFPALFAFLGRTFLPETPYFLARVGKLKKAAEVLSLATGKKIEAQAIAREEKLTSAPVSDLFAAKLFRATVVTIVAWVALNFSYYGLFIWLPQVLPQVQNFEVGNIYSLLLFSTLAQFPGYLASMWLVEAWGRKKTLSTFLILAGVSGLVFATTGSYASFLGGLFFVSFFNLGAWGAVYPYTVELFPTLLRGTAFGLAAEGAGKLTAILGPVVFGYLLDRTGGVVIPLIVVAIAMVAGGAVVAFLGHETKGKAMK